MMMQAKQQLRNPFFMEIFIIASWHIWKQINNFIFDGPPLSLGKPRFTRKPNFKPLDLVKKNDMLFSSV